MTISADQIPAQSQDKQPALESEMNMKMRKKPKN